MNKELTFVLEEPEDKLLFLEAFQELRKETMRTNLKKQEKIEYYMKQIKEGK